MKKFNTPNKSDMFNEQPDPNAVYGHCIHGENLATCNICNAKEVKPLLDINDPRFCYFIENEKGEWLVDRTDDSRVTKDSIKAMRFSGVNGKSIASIFLGLAHSKDNLLNFKVTEHEFITE